MATNQNATITKTEIRKGDCILKEIDASEILHRPFASNFLKRIGRGTAVGMATGLIVTTFRKIIDDTLQGLNVIYPYMRTHYLTLGAYLIGTVILWLIMSRLLKNHLFDIVGSGVPQVEDILHDEHWMSWRSVLWRKYVIGLMAICPGLFLGREGPCIQMGAAIGQGLAEKCFKSSRHETKVMIACGIAAGLSAAFSAPLAGALFLLEEITYTFESQTWLTALTAAIASDLVTLLFFGTRPCMWLPVTYRLPPATYLPLALFGILLGILAWFYQYCLINIHCWYGKISWLPRNRFRRGYRPAATSYTRVSSDDDAFGSLFYNSIRFFDDFLWCRSTRRDFHADSGTGCDLGWFCWLLDDPLWSHSCQSLHQSGGHWYGCLFWRN